MPEVRSRHEPFQAARTRAEWSIQQHWVGYLALGGTSDAFDIEAFLHGLAPLSDAQQDVLAAAVNERLDDLYLAARVPYLATVELPPCRCQDLLAVLDDLLAADAGNEQGEGSAMTTPESSPGAAEIGGIYAASAAVAVQSAEVLARTQRLAARLQAALETRGIIDRAVGIILSRSGGTETEALNLLQALSQHDHRNIAEVARHIVDEAVRRAGAHRHPE